MSRPNANQVPDQSLRNLQVPDPEVGLMPIPSTWFLEPHLYMVCAHSTNNYRPIQVFIRRSDYPRYEEHYRRDPQHPLHETIWPDFERTHAVTG